MKGRIKSAYCIFCECYGHHALYCKSWKLTFDEKKDIAVKHNACILCLKVQGHKLKDCPSEYKQCLKCGAKHNFNLHSQREKVDYFKDAKKEKIKFVQIQIVRQIGN